MKIYTKTGDQGSTSLFGGTRVDKDNAQIEAYGTVDELNSHLGLLISVVKEELLAGEMKAIQSILFDIGSHLASDGNISEHLPELDEEYILRLEHSMDRMTEELPKLRSFILPGGNQRIALAHVCRTICRRAERRVVSLEDVVEVENFVKIYLNRLSDYFFVVARYLSLLDGVNEVKWNPK
ncbi:MAG: cob(I)yrinic acid a,c-diamide adenosyltransferase [Bacteroidia bacterium]|nr:cob(I)yrinic acid a,c-diamide adenosyltransferase [Bacteroidia bacterium]MBT8230227.1 cob(I)yrinic acid a,c-diamide adenosyltransferase [Bacteroidia bacterium]